MDKVVESANLINATMKIDHKAEGETVEQKPVNSKDNADVSDSVTAISVANLKMDHDAKSERWSDDEWAAPASCASGDAEICTARQEHVDNTVYSGVVLQHAESVNLVEHFNDFSSGLPVWHLLG